MIIPRKIKYKIVKRGNLRNAVRHKCFQKEIFGWTKDGVLVYGRDLLSGKYSLSKDVELLSYSYFRSDKDIKLGKVYFLNDNTKNI